MKKWQLFTMLGFVIFAIFIFYIKDNFWVNASDQQEIDENEASVIAPLCLEDFIFRGIEPKLQYDTEDNMIISIIGEPERIEENQSKIVRRINDITITMIFI